MKILLLGALLAFVGSRCLNYFYKKQKNEKTNSKVIFTIHEIRRPKN